MQRLRIYSMEDRSWSDLPSELLLMILSRLPLPHHPSFSSVCKSWCDVSFKVYPANITPLLVYFKRWGDGILHCYSPSLNKSFRVSSPLDLSECELYSSKDGWLVLYREHEVILANPIANVMHNFPGLPFLNSFSGIAFYGRPPNKFMIFAIDSIITRYVEISIWYGKGWDSDIRYDNNYPFIAAPYASPVVHNGRFYCLGMEGNLGVFNPRRATWKVLANPRSFAYKPEESYLVESKGKLLAVLVGNHNPPVRVMSLNKAGMVWERVFTLRSTTLFAGPGVSLMTTNRPKRMKNKVLVSRLIGKPETIEAEIRHFEGRAFFVPKQSSHLQTSKGGRKHEATEKPGVCSYSLRTLKSSGYCDSIKYPCSIWYEPKRAKKSKLRFRM